MARKNLRANFFVVVVLLLLLCHAFPVSYTISVDNKRYILLQRQAVVSLLEQGVECDLHGEQYQV